MASKKPLPKEKNITQSTPEKTPMSSTTKRIIWSVAMGTLSLILLLSVFHAAGGVGEFIFTNVLKKLFGFGAFLVL